MSVLTMPCRTHKVAVYKATKSINPEKRSGTLNVTAWADPSEDPDGQDGSMFGGGLGRKITNHGHGHGLQQQLQPHAGETEARQALCTHMYSYPTCATIS